MADDKTPPETPIVKNDGRFKKGADPRRQTGSHPIRTDAGKTLTKMARANTPEAFDRLMQIIRDPDAKDRDAIAAIALLFTRGHGLPNQQIKVSGAVQHEHTTIDPAKLTSEMRRAILMARQEVMQPVGLIEDASFTEVGGDE